MTRPIVEIREAVNGWIVEIAGEREVSVPLGRNLQLLGLPLPGDSCTVTIESDEDGLGFRISIVNEYERNRAARRDD